MENLNLIASAERLKEIPLETFYFVDVSPKHMIDFVAHFVAGEDGQYLPKAEAARKVYTGRKVADIEQLVENLRAAMEEGVVPKA